MQFLIGTDGRRWLPYGREFTGYFGFSGTWEENLDHAVRSLGQVSLHISPRRYRVRLRPEALTWGAFQQLISALLDDEGKPVVLDIEGAGICPTEIYGKVDDAIARIDDLRAMNLRSGGRQWRASFIADVLSLQRLKKEAWQGLRAAYRNWTRRHGLLDRATLRQLLDAPLSAPLLLARIEPDGAPVCETWPGYIGLYTEAQLPGLIGRRFDEHPLSAYATRAAKGYRETDRDQVPRLELIEAVVRPEESEPVRLRYERLLLPWRTQDGTRFVGSLSRQLWRRVSACPTC
jgi:hypothetical protein